MGLLTSLITLPVSGPLKGLAWTARRVAEAADEQLDATSMEGHLAELERQRAFGEIDDAEHARAEDALWQRMRPDEETGDDREG